MGLRQQFRFSAQSETLVEECLRSLGEIALLDEERERFLFVNRYNEQQFEFDCIIVRGGIDVNRDGDYFKFLGIFIEALVSEFGPVTVANV